MRILMVISNYRFVLLYFNCLGIGNGSSRGGRAPVGPEPKSEDYPNMALPWMRILMYVTDFEGPCEGLKCRRALDMRPRTTKINVI